MWIPCSRRHYLHSKVSFSFSAYFGGFQIPTCCCYLHINPFSNREWNHSLTLLLLGIKDFLNWAVYAAQRCHYLWPPKFVIAESNFKHLIVVPFFFLICSAFEFDLIIGAFVFTARSCFLSVTWLSEFKNPLGSSKNACSFVHKAICNLNTVPVFED